MMRRREAILGIAGAIAAPPAARAQAAMPVVGFLSGQSSDTYARFGDIFRQALGKAGYVEGRNVAIEFRWAGGRPEALPKLAAELVRRRVAVIAATGGLATARAAKAATTTIPIVFNCGEDPVEAGLVANFNRPGGNVTGVSWFSTELTGKRLGLLHELVPAASVIALMVNPNDPESMTAVNGVEAAARTLGCRVIVVKAGTPGEIDAVLAAVAQQRICALVVGPGPFFVSRRAQIIALAAHYAIPTIYSNRNSPESGGLISYGNNLPDAYRRNAAYVARILKGARPGDLPVDRSTKFELVINQRTVDALGLRVPPLLLARADAVIE